LWGKALSLHYQCLLYNHLSHDNSICRRITTWLFLFGVIIFTIPNSVALYIFIRRAGNRGYLPHSKRRYTWNLCKPVSVWKNMDIFNARYDFLGLFMSSLGFTFVALSLNTPPKRDSGLSFGWTIVTIIGLGCIIVFAVWELYLNIHILLKPNEDHHRRDADHMSLTQAAGTRTTTSSRVRFKRKIIIVPNPDLDVLAQEELDASAARTAIRLEKLGRLNELSPDGTKQKNRLLYRCRPLIPGTLFFSIQFLVCLTCFIFASVSWMLGSWIVHDAPFLDTQSTWKHSIFSVSKVSSWV
jgi:hypothetical protein